MITAEVLQIWALEQAKELWERLEAQHRASCFPWYREEIIHTMAEHLLAAYQSGVELTQETAGEWNRPMGQ